MTVPKTLEIEVERARQTDVQERVRAKNRESPAAGDQGDKVSGDGTLSRMGAREIKD